MLNLTRSALQRYSIAVLAVVVALLLTQLLWWWLIKPTSIYPLFFAAVMVSSWYGGIGPGLLSTALAALACDYFFISPVYALGVSWSNNLVGLVQFVLVSVLIGSLNAALRSSQRRAETNAQQAQRHLERLRQTQEGLRQSEERYRLLVEGVTDYAIFMMDLNGHIISWNTGAERILGYQEVEIIGQPFSRIFSKEAIEHGVPEQALRTAVAQGWARDNRWHVRKDGSQFWAHCFITPLRDEAGNQRGFSKIMQDITQRKRAESERDQLLRREQAARAVSEAALSAAEAANRSKDEFLAMLSHELRTPLTAIIGWAGILHAGKLDEEKTALALETIERNANLQMQLIEDLLDISRIVRGDLPLSFRLVKPIQVITAAIDAVQPSADTKAIQLESVLEPSDNQVWGDPERLQQVVWNLLSNAIKFTPSGGRVEVRLEYVDSQVQIAVSDTGKGISADFLPYVFDRFRQADSTSTRVHKGLGLGLAIARHLVELHGGTIQAESQGSGQGATFTVKLPLRDVRSLETSLESEQSHVHPTIGDGVPLDSPPTLNGLRVLVVDDEADVRKFVSTVLEECGAEVTAVGSVEEALAALQHLKPDVLVSDIGMPGEDGYALIRKVRELEADIGGGIPAVALTGYARVEDHREALSAGFQLHVAKPVRPAELIAVVASLAE
jgi:PAS domain S-box-containing protein